MQLHRRHILATYIYNYTCIDDLLSIQHDNNDGQVGDERIRPLSLTNGQVNGQLMQFFRDDKE